MSSRQSKYIIALFKWDICVQICIFEIWNTIINILASKVDGFLWLLIWQIPLMLLDGSYERFVNTKIFALNNQQYTSTKHKRTDTHTHTLTSMTLNWQKAFSMYTNMCICTHFRKSKENYVGYINFIFIVK